MSTDEAQHRPESYSVSRSEDGPTSRQTRPYLPLDEHIDCTRFVKIEPATHQSEPLVCKLMHIAFGDRPVFQALSYVWGDETITEEILLDGTKHHVTRNLYDALYYLRQRGDDMIYWIDALSINQYDIAERNDQLRMMGQIYFRASMVIIWLGQRYTRFEMPRERKMRSMPGEWDSGSMEQNWSTKVESSILGSKSYESFLETRALVDELVTDTYWTRLWIIQEVGQARKRQVCFGRSAMDWDAVMALIASQDCKGKDVPLRLDRQLQEKYSGAHTLRSLLEDHRNAQCKDPKDKVYGLVGLAADARGFPLDYNKSLIDIWTDTMEFMNKYQLFDKVNRDSDIVHVAGLVRFLLMGAQYAPLHKIAPSEEIEAAPAVIFDETLRESEKIFQFEGHILGCISFIGSSTEEIVASPRKVDHWEQRVQERYKDDIGSAYRESRELLNIILESKEDTLADLLSERTSLIQWTALPTLKRSNSRLAAYRNWIQERKSKYSSQPSLQLQRTFSMRPSTMNLYQMHRLQSNGTSWKMGIASCQARPGDLLCWIRGTKKALVVRLSASVHGEHPQQDMLQVHGTALVTEDIASVEADHEQRLRTFDADDVLSLRMDAKMIYVLL